MSIARHHAEWLSLVEASGPFLSMKVLASVFPQGLDDIQPDLRARLRAAHEEWLDNVDGTRPDVAVHHAWIRYVLREALGFGDEDIVPGDRVGLTVRVPEQHETLIPDFAVVNPAGRDEAGKPRLLLSVLAATQDPNKPLANRFWKVSPVDRMLFLLRGAQAAQGSASKVRVGLVTNGDEWVLVHVAPGETATYVTWSSELFFDEPLTLRAFVSLLGLKRFFGVAPAEVLEALFADSSKDQHDVTDQLGLQVRRAVEILVQTIDRLDRDRGRVLLKGIPEATLYESAVTVMMRLVFLFAAEEKKLLLLGTPLYDENYAVSTLHDQLQATADRLGEEVLERRHDAWSRLLATFRAVFGGIDHTDLRLPAYGGSLFDPDRFPFLEGRPPGTSWRDTGASSPLAVDNRTVLHLLRALQRLQIRFPGGGPAETRRLSFRALDIEQIGHVYEGLLDHTAKRATGLTLSLDGKKEPDIALADVEAMRKKEKAAFLAWLAEATGRSESAIERALQYEIPKDEQRRWLAACDSRRPIYERVAPWAGLVRSDSHGNPVVIDEGAVYVTEGSDRRSTGTHYTPRSLTEPIVQHTLDPLVYDGPAEGKPREEWVLKPPKDILALRVCDLAMGSGAFLVQTCRYLSQKLVEGWETAEKNAGDKLVLAPNGDLSKGKPGDTLVPREVEERLVLARRFVADRCLYGVDVNPMAVEMAKLSLWLVTLQKNRPFSFVDHALRCGDSLLGVTSEEQLLYFHLDPERGKHVRENFLELGKKMKAALARSRELREKLESFPVRDISDSKQKAWLFTQANDATEDLRAIGDLLVGVALAPAGKKEGAFDDALRDASPMVASLLNAAGDARAKRRGEVVLKGAELLNRGREERQPRRTPFHWAVEFPEVFQAAGFDAFVGNPPFQYGTIAAQTLSEAYMRCLQAWAPPWHGKADLVVGFVKRAALLARDHGHVGAIATAGMIRGESLESGIRPLLAAGWTLRAATSPREWPGGANVDFISIVLSEGWRGGCWLDGRNVGAVTEDLEEAEAESSPDVQPRELDGALDGYMGVKLSPTNSRIRSDSDLGEKAAAALPAGSMKRAVGGDELYQLIDLDAARLVADPNVLGTLGREAQRAASRYLGADIGALGHSRPASALMDQIERLPLLFACGETSVHLAFRNVPRDGLLLTHKTIAFPTASWGTFAILQSTMHGLWSLRWGLRRRIWLTYSAKRCAQTFALPHSQELSRLAPVAKRYHQRRSALMTAHNEGLTDTYNRFHSPDEKSAPIKELRVLHVEMDEAVKHAYGWDNLPFDHGFHETKQGLRYTISEAGRVEVLDRLLALNHTRYAEELKAGLHDAGAKGKAKPAAGAKGGKAETKRKKGQAATNQGGLFGEEGERRP